MDPKLEQAIQAIKTGDKAAGLVLLAQFIRTDPSNESAWIWMATAQDDPERKKQCLERVLHINPANERVRRALATMFPPTIQPEAVPATIEAAPQAEAPKQEAKNAEEVKQWYEYMIAMRDAAGSANAAIRGGDEPAAKKSMEKLAQSCDNCHEVFNKEAKEKMKQEEGKE